MTNFFTHQDEARRNTRILIVLMVLAVLAMGIAIYLVCVVVAPFVGFAVDPRAAVAGGGRWIQPKLLGVTLGGTAAIVAVASAGRVLSLRGGGAHIAEMLGGRLVSGQPRDLLERRLLNVVEEMAIASGVPVPQVFVLDNEPGINAFAAGHAIEDAAVAATRGCLEKLTREELQGVVAHEMSHVLNGDMRLNVRLMGVVFGILCIGQLGRLLMHAGSSGGRSRSGFGRKSAGPGAAFALAGFGVVVIGWIGEMFGNVIKAAVSRQREFLADASAVQFTRNPRGIAGALKKIGGYTRGAEVSGSSALEASHFFFGDIHKRLFAHSPLATHPPLSERVARLEPGFRGEFPAVADGVAEPEDLPYAPLARAVRRASAPPGSPDQVAAGVGQLAPEALDEGHRLLQQLPPALREAADVPFSACAVVYGLALGGEPDLRARQLAAIGRGSGAALQRATEHLAPALDALPKRDRLLLADLLAPALRRLTAPQRTSFGQTLQALIDADARVSLFEYVLAHVLKDRLGTEPRRSRHGSLAAVQQELSLVLSLLAYAGTAEPASAAHAFEVAAKRVPAAALVLLPSSARLLSGLAPSLDALRALPPALSVQVVDAVAHAALSDRQVTDDEWTLLRAVCAALRCPLPAHLAAT